MWPRVEMPPLVAVNTYSLESLGLEILGQSLSFGASDFSSAAWPGANRALFVPFVLTKPVIIVKAFCYNGTVANTNMDIGIYDFHGTKLVSSGSVAQAGTSVLQEFDLTDTKLGPGKFYMALAIESVTGTTFRVNPTTLELGSFGVWQMAAAFPLPATAVFAEPASAYLPFIGITTRILV